MNTGTKQEEYIQILQEKNRLKKPFKTKGEIAQEEKERGFRTHFAGANQDSRSIHKIPTTLIASNISRVSSARVVVSRESEGGSTNAIAPNNSGPRKGWSVEPPKFILGAGGPVQIRNPKQPSTSLQHQERNIDGNNNEIIQSDYSDNRSQLPGPSRDYEYNDDDVAEDSVEDFHPSEASRLNRIGRSAIPPVSAANDGREEEEVEVEESVGYYTTTTRQQDDVDDPNDSCYDEEDFEESSDNENGGEMLVRQNIINYNGITSPKKSKSTRGTSVTMSQVMEPVDVPRESLEDSLSESSVQVFTTNRKSKVEQLQLSQRQGDASAGVSPRGPLPLQQPQQSTLAVDGSASKHDEGDVDGRLETDLASAKAKASGPTPSDVIHMTTQTSGTRTTRTTVRPTSSSGRSSSGLKIRSLQIAERQEKTEVSTEVSGDRELRTSSEDIALAIKRENDILKNKRRQDDKTVSRKSNGRYPTVDKSAASIDDDDQYEEYSQERKSDLKQHRQSERRPGGRDAAKASLGTSASDTAQLTSASQPAAVPAVNEALLLKLSALDSAQQEMLLKMLRNIEETSGSVSDGPVAVAVAASSTAAKSKPDVEGRRNSKEQVGGVPAATAAAVAPAALLASSIDSSGSSSSASELAASKAKGGSRSSRTSISKGSSKISAAPAMTPTVPSGNADSVSVSVADTTPLLPTTSASAPLVEPLQLRIRIHTNYNKSKTVSLALLRLIVKSSGMDIDLSQFKSQLFSGLLPLSQSSEAVRKLPLLLYQSTIAAGVGSRAHRVTGGSSEVWKGPLESGVPVVISLTGYVDPNYLSVSQGSELGADAFHDLELHIWNYKSNEASGSSSSSSGGGSSSSRSSSTSRSRSSVSAGRSVDAALHIGAKDVDVYVGSTCVWSGQIDEHPPNTTPAMARQYRRGNEVIDPPSIVISLSTKPKASSSSSTSTSDFYKQTSSDKIIESSDYQNSSKGNHRTDPTSLQVDDRNTPTPQEASSRPLWLIEDHHSTTATTSTGNPGALSNLSSGDLLTDTEPLVRSRPTSISSRRRRAEVANPSGVSEAEVASGALIVSKERGAEVYKPTSIPSQLVDSSATTKANQSRPAKPAVATTTSGNPPVLQVRPVDISTRFNHMPDSLQDAQQQQQQQPKPRRVRLADMPSSSHTASSKEEEVNLRKSLEAISQSDRHNRGRLGAAGNSILSNANQQSFANPSQLDRHADSLSSANTEQSYSSNSSNMGKGAGSATGATHSERLRQRSERIDKVQETVQTALASLADVMSSLNTNSGKSNRNRLRQHPSDPSTGTSYIQANNNSEIITNLRRVDEENESEELEDGNDVSSLPSSNSNNEDLEQEAEVEAASAAIDRLLAMSDLEELRGTSALDTSDAMQLQMESSLEGSLCLCEIPVLPSGQTLVIEILSTWGDPYYVGLNGLDLFDTDGELLRLNGGGIAGVTANPSNINVLPEYHDDPRIIQNILDDVCFTRDDLHVWLAPHGEDVTSCVTSASGGDLALPLVATITLQFDGKKSLSMMRFWNYNKSRTHCYRGIRRCRVLLDGAVVFFGEIKMASGLLDHPEQCSEVILFVTDGNILSKIAKSDENRGLVVTDETPSWQLGNSDSQIGPSAKATLITNRPNTATTSTDDDKDLVNNYGYGYGIKNISESVITRKVRAAVPPVSYQEASGNETSRPVTAAVRPPSSICSSGNGSNGRSRAVGENRIDKTVDAYGDRSQDESSLNPDLTSKVNKSSTTCNPATSSSMKKSLSQNVVEEKHLLRCQKIRIIIHSTWGDKSYVGLTGMEVLLGASCLVATDLSDDCISAEPFDLSAIGCFDDYRVPKNLLNGVNDTTDDSNMWLIPFTKNSSEQHYVEIDLKCPSKVAGIQVWNYNKSVEDSLRGAKKVSLVVDGKVVCQTVLRMAPGCDGVEFKQILLFKDLLSSASGITSTLTADSQNAKLSDSNGYLRYITPAVRQDYEVPLLPSGNLFKFTFPSNWGDAYYLGLDYIEIYDQHNNKINVNKYGSISAVPHSIRDLLVSQADARLPDNLISHSEGMSAANQARKSKDSSIEESGSKHLGWLAPLAVFMSKEEREQSGLRVLRRQRGYELVKSKYEKLPKHQQALRLGNRQDANSKSRLPAQGEYDYDYDHEEEENELFTYFEDNVLFLCFDYPVTVSCIRIFNYSKTPKRGVRELSLEIDGKLVYMGNLQPADKEKLGGGQCILFTTDAKVIRNDKDKVNYSGMAEQDVLCINERQVMVRSRSMFEAPDSTAVGIHSDLENRPTTAMVR